MRFSTMFLAALAVVAVSLAAKPVLAAEKPRVYGHVSLAEIRADLDKCKTTLAAHGFKDTTSDTYEAALDTCASNRAGEKGYVLIFNAQIVSPRSHNQP